MYFYIIDGYDFQSPSQKKGRIETSGNVPEEAMEILKSLRGIRKIVEATKLDTIDQLMAILSPKRKKDQQLTGARSGTLETPEAN